MSKTNVATTSNAELTEALDRFVASRPRNDRTEAMEAALAEKVGRLIRAFVAHEGAEVDAD
jgi:hypothetical protein